MSFAIPAAARAVRLVLAFLGAIRIDAFGNRVAVNAKRGGGVRNALFVSRVGFLDVKLFKFLERFIEKDLTVEHVFDYGFKAGANLHFNQSLESGV